MDGAIDLAIQIAQGLAKAHEHGITHRDIKPANVIITKDGVAKIVDFGLAKLASQPRLIKTGSTVGTMAYMSPEQARGEEVDRRADVWALGVVLYEMLAGQLPFKGEQEHAMMYAVLNATAKPLQELRADAPQALEQIVDKALTKGATKRYQSMSDMLAALNTLKQERSADTKDSPEVFPFFSWSRFQKMIRRKAIVSSLAFFFILMSIVVFMVLRYSGPKANDTTKQKRISLAVMYFENNTNDSELIWLSRGIPDMLISDLGRSPSLKIISPEKLAEIERMNIRQTGAGAINSTLLTAINSGASVLVTGSTIKAEGELRFLAQLYDLIADTLITTEKVSSKDHKTIFEMVDFLSMRLLLALEITASNNPGIAADIARTKTTSVEAYKYYVLGTQDLEKSQYRDAISNLLKAVQYDSSFAFAYAKLANVYDILGELTLAEQFIQKALAFSSRLSSVDQLRIRLQYAQLKSDWGRHFPISNNWLC